MTEEKTKRIDKWLWAVRLFKTRNLASEACRIGRVKLNGQPVKPSHEAHPGEIYTVNNGTITKTVMVLALINNRIPAKLVSEFLEDKTPPEEYERLQMKREMKQEWREPGTGRPTKKERREIDQLKGI